MRRTVVSTFAMNDSIVEVFMKRQWRVRRQLQSTADVGGVGTGPTNISWNGPYRASRFPLCCSRFALYREWRRGMRTAVYLRVSTNRQTQAQTMEQQWERLKAHLHLQGEQLLAENVFRDDGSSGASPTRPVWIDSVIE